MHEAWRASLGEHIRDTAGPLHLPLLAFRATATRRPDPSLIRDVSEGMPLSGVVPASGSLRLRAMPAAVSLQDLRATSDIRTPASSVVCTRFGTRRGFGTRMHLPRIWNSKRHVGPTRWRPRQEDGSKPAPTAPVGCRQPPGLPQIRNLAILGGPGQTASDRRFLRVPDLPIG